MATDNHLGYNEKDPVRCDDSFQSFEEILRLAREHNVDGILLGGDLFHENKPSRLTMHRTMELLRMYCLGDRSCELELLSDPSVNFPSKFGTVNYEDPNYNVAMPVFVIHGNHDDPSGEGNLSPIDILSTAGLVNYFGRTASVDDITMVPILLQKGASRLALYGLGGIRDERLHRTFLQKKVKMLRPATEEGIDWFSMLILHQNRVPHGPTNYIPETFLDDFLDLVVWGHEHESQACDPTVCAQRGFMVCQPGSSVATSLCEGEAKTKHVVILSLTGTDFETQAIPLRTVRPFITKDVALRNVSPPISPIDASAINAFLCKEVEALIDEARLEWQARNPAGAPTLPLIRVRVDCALPASSGQADPSKPYAIINPQRFGQQFNSKVANPRDILHYLRRKGGPGQRRLNAMALPDDASPADNAETAVRVDLLVNQYLDCQKLHLFAQNEFGDTLRMSIEKTDNALIERFVRDSIGRILDSQANVRVPAPLDMDVIKRDFERIKRNREEEWNRLHPTIESVLQSPDMTDALPATDLEPNGKEHEGESLLTPGRTLTTRGRGRGMELASGAKDHRQEDSKVLARPANPSFEGGNDEDNVVLVSDSDDESASQNHPTKSNGPSRASVRRKALGQEASVERPIGAVEPPLKKPTVSLASAKAEVPTWPSRRKT